MLCILCSGSHVSSSAPKPSHRTCRHNRCALLIHVPQELMSEYAQYLYQRCSETQDLGRHLKCDIYLMQRRIPCTPGSRPGQREHQQYLSHYSTAPSWAGCRCRHHVCNASTSTATCGQYNGSPNWAIFSSIWDAAEICWGTLHLCGLLDSTLLY